MGEAYVERFYSVHSIPISPVSQSLEYLQRIPFESTLLAKDVPSLSQCHHLSPPNPMVVVQLWTTTTREIAKKSGQ